MKKYIVLSSILIMLVCASFLVSATPGKQTVVTGIIYNSDFSSVISGVDVVATCNDFTESGVSGDDGVYFIQFNPTKCGEGDTVTVVAIKEDLSGMDDGNVHDFGLSINLAIVNISMTPEFGFVFGVMTLLSAVGIFFVVRKD